MRGYKKMYKYKKLKKKTQRTGKMIFKKFAGHFDPSPRSAVKTAITSYRTVMLIRHANSQNQQAMNKRDHTKRYKSEMSRRAPKAIME